MFRHLSDYGGEELNGELKWPSDEELKETFQDFPPFDGEELDLSPIPEGIENNYYEVPIRSISSEDWFLDDFSIIAASLLELNEIWFQKIECHYGPFKGGEGPKLSLLPGIRRSAKDENSNVRRSKKRNRAR